VKVKAGPVSSQTDTARPGTNIPEQSNGGLFRLVVNYFYIVINPVGGENSDSMKNDCLVGWMAERHHSTNGEYAKYPSNTR